MAYPYFASLFETMNLIDFVSLSFDEQLLTLEHAELKHSFSLDGSEFYLYQVNDFFVEVKRKLPDLHFEKMNTMYFEDLPQEYKLIVSPESR